jgi:hypothetical protein
MWVTPNLVPQLLPSWSLIRVPQYRDFPLSRDAETWERFLTLLLKSLVSVDWSPLTVLVASENVRFLGLSIFDQSELNLIPGGWVGTKKKWFFVVNFSNPLRSQMRWSLQKLNYVEWTNNRISGLYRDSPGSDCWHLGIRILVFKISSASRVLPLVESYSESSHASVLAESFQLYDECAEVESFASTFCGFWTRLGLRLWSDYKLEKESNSNTIN